MNKPYLTPRSRRAKPAEGRRSRSSLRQGAEAETDRPVPLGARQLRGTRRRNSLSLRLPGVCSCRAFGALTEGRVADAGRGRCIGPGEWVKVPLAKVAAVRAAGSLGRAPEDWARVGLRPSSGDLQWMHSAGRGCPPRARFFPPQT